jgi:hypothetical protein
MPYNQLAMNRSLVLIFLVSAAIACAQSPEPAKLLLVDQTLISAEKDFLAAAKKGDTAFLQRTLAENFTHVGTDGQLGDRQGMIDDLSDGGQNIQPYDMKVVRVCDDVAVVTYDAIVQVPPEEDQGPPPRYQHFSSTWVKQGDTWKMKFQQKTPVRWGDW